MHLLSYDIGTSGVKTCLYQLEDQKLTTVGSSLREYDLRIYPDGGAEQDPNQWWEALCDSTKELRERFPEEIDQVEGISFCSQMQSVVLVDKEGNALRPSMSYMDQRAEKQRREGIAHGIRISGLNARKVLVSLRHTGAVSASVKDPVWKYLWVRDNELEVFAKIHRWLDVKEYLIGRMTGRFIMSEDSAFAALLLDVHSKTPQWSKPVCKLFDINMDHLPEIVTSTTVVGPLRAKQAEELGLREGVKVIAGGGDSSLIPVGAGATKLNDTHIYWGTSGWVGTVTNKQKVDLGAMIASVTGAQHGFYNYFAEMETAGKCFQWVRDHLALDEINIYLEKKDATANPEAQNTSLYEYMSQVIETSPPGSNGVIFTPWLHGNRCPFEDPNARAMFFNLGIETGKRDMLRAVIEGVCFHLRWFLETQERKVKTSETVRFVGGGALSPTTCQILADILGRTVEIVEDPQNVGSVGAAIVTACGLGVFSSVNSGAQLIKPSHRYVPNPDNRAVYDHTFAAFISLYKNNKKTFAMLNGGRK
ncbi:xylulokinase [Arcanobacterium pluranimalium]|uniref:xylulokinase n=1 Tax=Arcanobacterium pluranimalium TaxID=108028 RepID=UPI0019594852|nr:FGGY-family carbohydrate kinase [Arcanobacterium pluranimalium]MBM7824413.1 xylulokinase [Arcanobacterium pluranimalium]